MVMIIIQNSIIKEKITNTKRHFPLQYFETVHYNIPHYASNGHLVLFRIKSYDDYLANIKIDGKAVSFHVIESEIGNIFRWVD